MGYQTEKKNSLLGGDKIPIDSLTQETNEI